MNVSTFPSRSLGFAFPAAFAAALALASPAVSAKEATSGAGAPSSESAPSAEPAIMEPAMEAAEPTAEYAPRVYSASEFLGREVLDSSSGESLGSIDEVILDDSLQMAAFFRLESGGLLGIGSTTSYLPWDSLAISLDPAEPLRGDSTRIRPESDFAPAEDSDQEAFESRRLSDIAGLPVVNSADEPLGQLEGIVLDATEGRAVYAFVSTSDSSEELDFDRSVVPWSQVFIGGDPAQAHANATTSALRASAYDREGAELLGNASYAQAVHDAYGIEPYWITFGYAEAEPAPAVDVPMIEEEGDDSSGGDDSGSDM